MWTLSAPAPLEFPSPLSFFGLLVVVDLVLLTRVVSVLRGGRVNLLLGVDRLSPRVLLVGSLLEQLQELVGPGIELSIRYEDSN